MPHTEKVISLADHTNDSEGANKDVLRQISARIISVTKNNGLTDSNAEPGKSQANPEEPFVGLAKEGRIIEPPFDFFTLALLPEHSSELGQCIEAMETNIAGTGHRFVSRLKTEVLMPHPPAPSTPGDKKSPNAATSVKPSSSEQVVIDEAAAERVKLVNFFEYATRESFIAFKRKLRRDIEATGNCYFEVIRNVAGKIQGFNHLPSYQIRLGRLEEKRILVERKILELQVDGSVEVKTIKEWRRFRPYVQSRTISRGSIHGATSHNAVWFKEFGDVRHLHKELGEYGDGDKIPEDMRATEIVHSKIYSARSPYGLPRYVGNLLAIFGDRASEEINYITFKNNNIPSMIIMVSNGTLTEGSIERITSFVESKIQGSDNYSKFLILEGEPLQEDGEDAGQVKLEIKPLTEDQHKDALFQNYSGTQTDKIRRAFRLPPIFVGRSDDYTRSTAESSRRLADEQIFAPERDEFDTLFNRTLFPDMEIIYHKFKSNSPNTTDNTQLVKILAGAEKTGGMTPRIARTLLEDILGIDLPDLPPDFPADIPFSLTMAEAVKNEADPSEPGQTVTALKALGILGDIQLDNDDDVAALGEKLIAMNKSVEKLWRANADAEE